MARPAGNTPKNKGVFDQIDQSIDPQTNSNKTPLFLSSRRYRWTPDKVESLKLLVAQGLNNQAIATQLQVTACSVHTARTRLAIPSVGTKWTANDLDEVRALIASGVAREEIAEHFGVTEVAIRSLCSKHKISLPNSNYKPWSSSEEFFLDESAGMMPTADIARKLKRTKEAVLLKAGKMGLSLRPTLDNVSACELSRLTGISYKTVYKWIRQGRLKATKLKSGFQYKIKLKNFALFAKLNPNNPAIKRVDMQVLRWFEGISNG